mgnify:CR=1 FL=1
MRRIQSMGIRDRPTSPRSPWQNGHEERLIGSIRKECLDHVVIFGERHLRHVLLSYINYYNDTRTHLSLNKDAPQVALVPTPASARVLIAQKSDTTGEMRKALSAIRTMLTDPSIVVRFAGQNDILSVEGLDDLGREIEIKQALFDFGAALVQFDLFGGFVAAPTKKNRRR